MKRKMCVYRINEFPYIAVGNAYKVAGNRCFVEDTSGKMKKVDPLYVGSFDSEKLLEYGFLLISSLNKMNDLKNNIESRSFEIFNGARA